MTARLLAFLAVLAGGALGGWLLGHERGAAAGVAVAAVAWFALDTWRAVRLLRWLRQDAMREATPTLRGPWGEAAQRITRALRLRDTDLQETRGRLEDFLGAIRGSPNGVVLLDAAGRIEWCNDTAASQLGLDPVRDLQQHIVNLVREPAFTAYFHGSEFDADLVMAAPGSSPARPVKLSVRLHPYGEGRRLLLSRDVTAVDQAEAMRRDFVANVSHEIRTPLTVLAGFIETLQTLPLPPEEQGRYLQLMARQSQRMQTLVSDLLTLSRLEGSPLPGAAEWTPLAALVAQCEQEAQALAQALGKDLGLRFGPVPPLQLAGAASELVSAMSNLVSNGVRYTPAGGSVEVDTRVLADGRLEFSVRDTGPGIAAEHLPRLTERFYRVDRSRSRETGGTGLGLAIVKHVAQRHGGELRITSVPGTGSTFTLQLPAARLRPLAPDASAAPRATGSAAG